MSFVPFKPCRESCSASASQTSYLNGVDYVLRGHFLNRFFSGFITVYGQIILNAFWIDNTTILEHHALLFSDHFLVLRGHFQICNIFLPKDMFIYNTFDIRGIYIDIGNLIAGRINHIHNGFQITGTNTAGFFKIDAQILCGNLVFKRFFYLCGASSDTTASLSNDYFIFFHRLRLLFLQFC